MASIFFQIYHCQRPRSNSAIKVAEQSSSLLGEEEQEVGNDEPQTDCSTLTRAKSDINKALQGINRGIFGITSEKKSEIEDLVKALEFLNPNPHPTVDLDKLGGCWKLLDLDKVHSTKYFCSEYEKSKAVADKIALEAAREGVPIVALYPGVIYGLWTRQSHCWECCGPIVSPRSQGTRPTGGTPSGLDGKAMGEESTKRRRVSSAKQAVESSSSGDEPLSALPCLVALNPGVRIATVAAGGRHTLALSDTGALMTFGWGLYGQVGC